MEKSDVEFKKLNISIFSLNYFIQGLNTSMFAVIIPIYLILELKTVASEDIALLTSTVLLPFAIKFAYGILSDKFSFKKLGRRKPWIIGPISISGLLWVILPFIITPKSVFMTFLISGVFIILGVAIADTAIDGLILDICPKEQLGRTQGICWGVRSVGIITGGPLIVAIYLLVGGNIMLIFIGLGIVMISTSLTILFIKEIITPKDIDIIANLKLIFGKVKNWKVYTYSLFNSFGDGVIFVFLSLFIIIQTPLLGAEGATIEILSTNTDLYTANAFISFIIGLGVIVGSLIGGYISDLKSRKISVYISLLITCSSLLLLLIPAPVPILIFFAFLIGASSGWRISSFSVVIGQISTQYPKVASTYYATCNSFANIGTVLGLQITGFLFASLIGFDSYMIYSIIFLFMAFLSIIGIIPFRTINAEEYELNLDEKE